MRMYPMLVCGVILALVATTTTRGAKKDQLPSRKAKVVVPLLKNLSAEATYEDVLEILGEAGPDTGRGIHIHQFELKGGKSVRVGTPDYKSICYVDLIKKESAPVERLFPPSAASGTDSGKSAIEGQLAQLNAQHRKQLADVTAPVNQLYRNSLKELLKQAEESGNTAIALKILTAYLEGTVWNISNQSPDGNVLYTLSFSRNGRFRHSDGRTGGWKATGPRDLKLWNWDPAALNADLTRFRAVGTGVIYFGKLQKSENALEEATIVPKAAETGPLESTDGEVMIDVKMDGRFQVEGNAMSNAKLRKMLEELHSAHEDQAVIIRGVELTAFDDIVAVLNLCQEAGIWNIAFATRRPTPASP